MPHIAGRVARPRQASPDAARSHARSRYAPRVDAARPSVLLGLTGLRIDGGIAGVSRCVARALEEAVAASSLARCDRVLLLEDPRSAFEPPRRGVQRFARG